jgi:DNA-binding protein H-NS
MNILKKANQIVNERAEEKERQYGPFEDCMCRAATIYNLMAPEGEKMSTVGMYRAMIAMKLAREARAHKEDNLLDAVAYIGALNNHYEDNNF